MESSNQWHFAKNIAAPVLLLFADDIFIFINGDLANLRAFKKILRIHQISSGQMVNVTKSKLFLGPMNQSKKNRIEETMRMNEANLRGREEKSYIWNIIIEKLQAKLAREKSNPLISGKSDLGEISPNEHPNLQHVYL